MIRHIDLGALRSFLLIAQGRSFTQTSELVGRSPSAISLQIQRLEEDLGARLLRRSTREVALTLAGERLLGFAQRLVRINDEALLAFHAGGSAPTPCASVQPRMWRRRFSRRCCAGSRSNIPPWS